MSRPGWLVHAEHKARDKAERCTCGGRIVRENRRGVEHLICQSCSVCAKCDFSAAKYGAHRPEGQKP